MDLQEKISPTAKEMLKRMLGLTELPDFLLVKYFTIKKMIDRVDGILSPMDLARIALDCGFDPNTMAFMETKEVMVIDKDKCSIKDLQAIAEAKQGDMVLVDQCTLDGLTIKKIEIPPETILPSPTGTFQEQVNGEIAEAEEAIEEYGIKIGTSVTTIISENYVTGKVVGKNVKEDGEVTYDVEFDDETLALGEDEIEVAE